MSVYPCNVSFTRYFVSGNLNGLTHEDTMGFISWEDACKWAATVTESPKVNYVVTEMTNLETGEWETF